MYGIKYFEMDIDTSLSSYDTAKYDSEAMPVILWLCELFNIEIISNLTELSEYGHIYYIGTTEPKFKLQWERYSSDAFLKMSTMYNGTVFESELYKKTIIYKSDSGDRNNRRYMNFWYVQADNIGGIGAYKASKDPLLNVSSSDSMRVLVTICTHMNDDVKVINKQAAQTNYPYMSINILDNFQEYTLLPADIHLILLKDRIANSNYDYLSQLKIPNNIDIPNLFACTKNNLNVGSAYRINSALYMCIAGFNYYTMLIKVGE